MSYRQIFSCEEGLHPDSHILQGSTVYVFTALWMLKPIHTILSFETREGKGIA